MPSPGRELTHAIGGVAITLADFAVPLPSFLRLYAPTTAPQVTLRLRAVNTDAPVRPPGTPVIEVDSWAAFVDDDIVSIVGKNADPSEHDTVRIELPRAGLDGRFVYGEAYPYVFQHPFDQLLVVHALGVAGGALMHAAGIAGRDGALLVSGPSGAGKTTMSRACAALGAAILSDERTIVRPDVGGWVAGGTPWPGEGGFADNRSVPLRGLIVLEQSDRNELVPLSPARALALLYRCHFPPLWDRVASERTLAHLESLVRAVPAWLFRNRKEPDSARMLLATVGGVP